MSRSTGEIIRHLVRDFEIRLKLDLANRSNERTTMKNIAEHVIPGTSLLEKASRTGTKAQATTKKKKKAPWEVNDASGSEYDPDEESDAESDDDVVETMSHELEPDDDFTEDGLVVFLKDMEEFIEQKHATRPLDKVDGLRPGIEPFPHQSVAAAFIKMADETPFKGALLADPPGLGKTLSSLMAMASTPKNGRGLCVVVAPSSCCRQWLAEIARYFDPSALKAVMLVGERVPLPELLKYDVAITSYHALSAELRRKKHFLRRLRDFEAGKLRTAPKRPELYLLSSIFREDPSMKLGKFLFLDESQNIKNIRSVMYEAVELLRDVMEVCICITGTPLDNTWLDAYAPLSLCYNHPILSHWRMRRAFSTPSPRGKIDVPKMHYLTRLIQMLDGITLRRLPIVLADRLPSYRSDVVHFPLTAQERSESNSAFSEYEQSLRSNGDPNHPKRPKSKEEKIAGWSALTRAHQHANHPMLVRIMKYEREHMIANLNSMDNADNVAEENEEDEQFLATWRQSLRQNENWRSSRVDALLDLIVKHLDLQPDAVFLVVDESVYFLDILEIAVQSLYEKLPCFRYDGRTGPAERSITLQRFFDAQGPRVMLASRGTGGVGLNVQCANVVIRSGPWWKKSWEDQAEGRVFRPGQLRPVYVYEMRALQCSVEKYKSKARDQKDALNSIIMRNITTTDAVHSPRFIS